ncbi:prepilin-type N-terminal cleavage/methylation domain-containing protein [Mobilitalea sibirica]|uniref:Prepilin-type N-terminal cleavage/methylation domain-containing protein n=1 Tax=Mobilitalea sibirica TaxID=1462919 RepID=A0A8J7KRZ0_9FIRM|nr:prepilin-type N-terminal cleavage/methylation domain-containing protein [Mobilitalea sibirica]MBH1939786.1 prepilin-type N-terminal cleavage/methylation domain-containing protein [Mobilitalea sibirica]
MEKSRIHKKPLKMNNKGFSLVELLISIVVLVIIMVPLMNNFFRSMIMNKKAEAYQVQSNLAASIMEGLKDLTMDETIAQFNGGFSMLTEIPGSLSIGEAVQLEEVPGGYNKSDIPLYEQSTYYFAIHDIKVGGTAYDAFIKMNPQTYKNAADTMNNFSMPDVINLDEKANGFLFSTGVSETDTVDANALAAFVALGRDYAYKLWKETVYQAYLDAKLLWDEEREIAEMEGSPLPTPLPIPSFDINDPTYEDYCKETIIKTYITKTMKISVSDDVIDYQINYQCEWPISTTGLDTVINYPICTKSYAETSLQNIYLFYTPSDFQASKEDVIELGNPGGDSLHFFVARQNVMAIPLGKGIKINQLADDAVEVYIDNEQFSDPITGNLLAESVIAGTPMGMGDITPDMMKSEKKDRIYDVTISIYPYEDGEPMNKYQRELYRLQSTREK